MLLYLKIACLRYHFQSISVLDAARNHRNIVRLFKSILILSCLNLCPLSYTYYSRFAGGICVNTDHTFLASYLSSSSLIPFITAIILAINNKVFQLPVLFNFLSLPLSF